MSFSVDRLAAVAIIFTGLLCLCLSGCLSTAESDIPWNAPQPWEGSPAIPGLDGGGSGRY